MTGPVDLGQTYRYRFPVTNTAGAPANAGTVVVTITKPDGTIATPGVVNSSTGFYDIAYLTSVVGLHNVSVDATGGILGSEHDVYSDSFIAEVWRAFVGVDEAISHMRATVTITSAEDREQLRWLCMSACEAVERDLNRTIARKTVTDTYNGGGSAIILRSSPVLSITSVNESGASLTSTDYVLDAASGMLHRGTSTSWLTFAWGRQNVTVQYVVGEIMPPWPAREVAKSLIQALWQESQQAPRPWMDESVAGPGEAILPGLLAGIPEPLRKAYNKLRRPGVA